MLSHVCDGCGGVIKGECAECGLCVTCEYCPNCRAVYAEFEQDRDRLHDKIAKMWGREFTALREAYAQRLARLPDPT